VHPDDSLLNAYIDETLDNDDRAAIERHLEACLSCRSLVRDFSALTSAAAALGDIEPPARAWQSITARINAEAADGRRIFATSALVWLAAAAAIVLAAWVGVRYAPAETAVTSDVTTAMVEAELHEAEQHYLNAVGALQQIATNQSAALDPVTMATLQRNLAVIDQAIAESRAAVLAQPSSDQAQASLFDGLKAKIALLNDAVALIAESQKGKG